MKQSKTLKTLTIQELRTLIFKDVVRLEQLSDANLEVLFQYETDAVCKNSEDAAFLLRIANLMVERESNAGAINLFFEDKIRKIVVSFPDWSQDNT